MILLDGEHTPPPPPAVDSCLPSFRSRKSCTNYLLNNHSQQQAERSGTNISKSPVRPTQGAQGCAVRRGWWPRVCSTTVAAPSGEEPVRTGTRQLVTQTPGLRASWTLTEGTPFREVGKYRASIPLNNTCSPLREDAGESIEIWKEEPGLSVWLPRYQNSFTFLYHR